MSIARLTSMLLALLVLLGATGPGLAFSGFYVGKADTRLFNQASKVVIARHDGRTVITMVNDYQGALQEFALVVPVPQLLERGQIHVTQNALVDRLDAYTAPRLVERFDPDPCHAVIADSPAVQPARQVDEASAKALGVSVEAQYTAGEYDILILSAEQSAGLATWLREDGYRLSPSADQALATYLAAGMQFVLARVKLAEQSKLRSSYLRPLQIAFESESFVLPIRLGMLNAAGPQELLVLLLTRGGRVASVAHRTVEIPSEVELPLFVKTEFGPFYDAMLASQAAKENMPAIFLEYAWDGSWCDPCAADPLKFEELRELGAFWLLEAAASPAGAMAEPDVFVTRLHLRYDAEHFPHDLRFRETSDRSNFQGRYVLRHPWRGEPRCPAAQDYVRDLPGQFERQAQNVARLTAWPLQKIRDKMEANGQLFAPPNLAPDTRRWWEKLWPDNQPK